MRRRLGENRQLQDGELFEGDFYHADISSEQTIDLSL